MEVNVFDQDENLTFMILVMENTLIHSFRQIFDSSWKKNKNQQQKKKQQQFYVIQRNNQICLKSLCAFSIYK